MEGTGVVEGDVPKSKPSTDTFPRGRQVVCASVGPNVFQSICAWLEASVALEKEVVEVEPPMLSMTFLPML